MNVFVVDRLSGSTVSTGSNVGAIAWWSYWFITISIVIVLILIVVILVIILKCRSNDVSNQGIAIIGFFNIIMHACSVLYSCILCRRIDEYSKETHFKMENNIVYGVTVERPGIQSNSAWVWALKISLP